MQRSWLVQRLRAPFKGKADTPLGKIVEANPYAFGGGMRNGGLQDEAMDLIAPLCQFDYMGSAEFEYGDVPRAFEKITKYKSAKTLSTDSVINFKTRKVYIICNADDSDEVKKRIKIWARKSYGEDLKEATRLKAALTDEKFGGETKGWLELNNGFMFFVDYEMFTGFSKLFGALPPKLAKGTANDCSKTNSVTP